MKNTTKYLLTIFTVSVLSCSNDNYFNVPESDYNNSNISISVISIHGKLETSSIHIRGHFVNGQNQGLTQVNNFLVNDLEIPFDKDRYFELYSNTNNDNYDEIIQKFTGKQILIDVDQKNDALDIANLSVYNPKPMIFNIDQDHSNISKEKGIRITWTPDTNSSNRNEDEIGLYVAYRGQVDGEGTNLPNISYNTVTEDDGEFYISESDLSAFPTNSKIDINVGRLNYESVNHSIGTETDIYIHSLDSHGAILNQ